MRVNVLLLGFTLRVYHGYLYYFYESEAVMIWPKMMCQDTVSVFPPHNRFGWGVMFRGSKLTRVTQKLISCLKEAHDYADFSGDNIIEI